MTSSTDQSRQVRAGARARALGLGRTRRALYDKLRAQIADGSLAPGSAVPSSRGLAAELGVARTMVVAVFEQLAAEGYIETRPGARARVAAGAMPTAGGRATGPGLGEPASAHRALTSAGLSAYGRRIQDLALPVPPSPQGAPPTIDFLYGALSAGDFPTLLWRRAYARALVQRQARHYYALPEGDATLRRELQGYLHRARGLVCDAEQILVVQGSQQAIDLCARVLVDPGDPVVIEDPCYLMARRAFEAAGAAMRAVPVDEQGLDTRQLPPARTRLAYVTPSHQFPLGGVLPIARRHELLSWARSQKAWIVEDDYDGEFRYGMRPVDSLQSLDETGSVIYIGTFSKALSPQLRLGYLVLPPALVAVFRQAKQLCDRHAPRLEQVVLASLIQSGAYERHVRRLRRANERRRSALVEAIRRHLPESVNIEGAASGLHLVAWLADVPTPDEAALVALARQHGVGVWPISPLYAQGRRWRARPCAGLVLGYAGLEPDQIEQGIRQLGAAVRELGRLRK